MNVRAGWASAQGGRTYQEDRLEGSVDKTANVCVWAVYDGHGGASVAEHLAQNRFGAALARTISSTPPGAAASSVRAKIQAFFLDWDQRHYARVPAMGATVCAAVLHATTLWIAWCGDSRAIVFDSRAHVLAATRDHKPTNEVQRVLTAGGTVVGNRVNGVLATSRAMGDADLKRCRNDGSFTPSRGAVTALPDVHRMVLRSKSVVYLCVATDGVWDAYGSNEEAARALRNALVDAHGDANAACRAVLAGLERQRPGVVDDNKTLWLVRIACA